MLQHSCRRPEFGPAVGRRRPTRSVLPSSGGSRRSIVGPVTPIDRRLGPVEHETIAGRPGPSRRRAYLRRIRAILDSSAIAEIYRRFRDGDDAATHQVRDWTAGVVRGGAWRFVDDEAVIQETLVTLVRLAQEDKISEPGGFQKFVYTVAKRTCVAQCYRDKRRREHEVAEESAPERAVPPDDTPDGRERRARIEALGFVLQQLSDDCRELWDRIYCRGQSSGEIAGELNITANNVRVRTHRCMEKARTLMRRYQRNHPGLEGGAVGSAR